MFSAARLPNGQLVRRCSAFSVGSVFDEDNVRRTVAKFAKTQLVKPPPSASSSSRNAAVLVPLCVVDGEVSLLYTLRAPNLKTHRGQVSFPGGLESAGDKTPEETAIRETQEELGISKERIEVWGRGKAVPSLGAVFSVLPVIGVVRIGDLHKELRIDPNEVSEVFTVPLEVLCRPSHIRHTQFRRSISLPVYTGGKRRIWGLTAIITHSFLKALFPRETYDPSIKYIPPLRGSLPHRLF